MSLSSRASKWLFHYTKSTHHEEKSREVTAQSKRCNCQNEEAHVADSLDRSDFGIQMQKKAIPNLYDVIRSSGQLMRRPLDVACERGSDCLCYPLRPLYPNNRGSRHGIKW